MDFFLVEKIAVRRLQQRCIDRDRDTLLVRIDRNGGVVVSRAEWAAIGEAFRRSTCRSAQVLRWTLWWQIPAALTLLAVIVGRPLLRRWFDGGRERCREGSGCRCRSRCRLPG